MRTSKYCHGGEEEHSYQIITQWEKELKLLEDRLILPDIEEYFPRDAVVKSGEEFQPEDQLENVGLVPAEKDDRRAEGLAEGELSEEITKH
jgi:hypothetical protein